MSEISSLDYVEHIVRSVISICTGAGRLASTGAGEGGRERESRALCGGCEKSAGLAGPRGCCAGRGSRGAQINISRCLGNAEPDRVPPILHASL